MNRKRLCVILIVVFALNIGIIALVQNAGAATIQHGSQGSLVEKVQTKLSEQDFYFGAVDGIFGSKTEEAVKKYQKTYGLAVDGRVGNATLAALGIASQEASNSNSGDINLLARLISAEGRGEPYNGQVAIGAVVLNRVEHPSFPNSLAGVIYQSNAFTCVTDGQFDEPVADSAYKAARDALNGSDPTGSAIYYFNPATATSSWIWSRPLITVIGKHRFCA